MNDRIQELAEQAQDWVDQQRPYASEEHEYFVEKFAELIVRECAYAAWINGMDEYKKILKHFGVE